VLEWCAENFDFSVPETVFVSCQSSSHPPPPPPLPPPPPPPPQVMAEVLKSEKAIKERVGIGMSVPERALVNELKDRGIDEVYLLQSQLSFPWW
jgi:hypothetical protein